MRSIDIANELNVSKPSVSVAMKHCREDGYIEVGTDGEISLTQKGMQIACRMMERHNIIARALIKIGVDKDTAYEDSCKIEHVISDETIEKIKEFVESKTQL